MRKVGVLITAVSCLILLISIVTVIAWAVFNNCPKTLPTWGNLLLGIPFLFVMLGLSIVSYTYRQFIISEIKKLY